MRLMMCEYTATPEKGPKVHGVCNRRRLEHVIEEGSIVAKMIEDDAAAKLIAKWEGDIEPVPKKKSVPDVQVPTNPAPSTLTQAENDAANAAIKANAAAAANLKKVEKVV